ncbi:MAG: xylose ABC transporter ATP-binding protein [Spirochaetes bacterium]|nr:xylose ABC transporter ATP-binding protein [Spirochaetota bacterium]
MADFILEMRNITKRFPGVIALNDVNLNVKRGEIHALCGENGAGKSTLMKILSGVYPHGSYEGEIVINGEEQRFGGIRESEKAGVSIIYQELELIKELDVGENIFLGIQPLKMGTIDWNRLYFDTRKLLQDVGLDIDPGIKIKDLGVGQQQLVEIAKALRKKTDILVLDEPTAALTEHEIELLMKILHDLKNKGITCIYISHKLNEMFRIADSITVLRDGKSIATHKLNEVDEPKVVSLMVGRELEERFPKKEHSPKEVVFELRNFTVYDTEYQDIAIIENVSLSLRKGEIVGVFGLMGAGRTELVSSIFGAFGGKKNGSVLVHGKAVEIHEPRDAIVSGMGLLSEDRKRYGLIINQSVSSNMTLASLDRICDFGRINSSKEFYLTGEYVKDLDIKVRSLDSKVSSLSGGNQQKVVLGKWLMTSPDILFLDEPTRGIDVGAKYEIYNLMNKLVDQGVAIMMISSELPEILGMSDRILVMHAGRFSGEFLYGEATQEKIMYYATGGE